MGVIQVIDHSGAAHELDAVEGWRDHPRGWVDRAQAVGVEACEAHQLVARVGVLFVAVVFVHGTGAGLGMAFGGFANAALALVAALALCGVRHESTVPQREQCS